MFIPMDFFFSVGKCYYRLIDSPKGWNLKDKTPSDKWVLNFVSHLAWPAPREEEECRERPRGSPLVPLFLCHHLRVREKPQVQGRPMSQHCLGLTSTSVEGLTYTLLLEIKCNLNPVWFTFGMWSWTVNLQYPKPKDIYSFSPSSWTLPLKHKFYLFRNT